MKDVLAEHQVGWILWLSRGRTIHIARISQKTRKTELYLIITCSHPSGGPCSTLQSPTRFKYHSVPLDVFWLSPRHRGILGKRGGTRSSQSPSAVLPQVPLILLGGLALGYHNSCAAMVGDMDRLVTQWIAPKQCIEVMVVTSNPCLIYTTWNGPKNFNISSWRS